MSGAAADARCRCGTLGVSAEAAAILLACAMRSSEAPAAELGAALARLERGLRPGAGAPGPELGRELAACVRALQFHDRLMQQLAVIRDLLTRLAGRPLPQMAGGVPCWDELLAALRAHLAAGAHDELLELLPRSGGAGMPDTRPGAAAEGSGELF
jgi:hypothetical protein